MVARRCSAEKLPRKFLKIYRETSVLESVPNNVIGLQAIRLATLSKKDSGTDVLDQAVLTKLKRSAESTCVGVCQAASFQSAIFLKDRLSHRYFL